MQDNIYSHTVTKISSKHGQFAILGANLRLGTLYETFFHIKLNCNNLNHGSPPKGDQALSLSHRAPGRTLYKTSCHIGL